MLRQRLPLVLLVLLVLAVLVPSLTPAAENGKKLKAKDLLLPRSGYPEITEEQAALSEVDYAPGHPAVVLRESQEYEWLDDFRGVKDRYFRRLKVLTEGGIEEYGNFTYSLYGDLRVQKVQARTVLPDGTEIDAADGVNQEETDDGYKVISVAFPQVQVGSILDVDIQLVSDNWSVEPWQVQGEVPVLDTRLVIRPPTGLRFRIVPYRLPAEKSQPDYTVPVAAGSKAYGWVMEDVEPLPELAFMPPDEDVSQRLFVILEQFKNEYAFAALAKDWPSWGDIESEYWEDWFKQSHGKVTALAKEVIPPEASPIDKAEAVRVALKDRYRSTIRGNFHGEGTPDERLEQGSGPTGGLAGLAVLMLRAAGLDADLAVYRHRSDGAVPREIPIPRLMTDVLVRIPGPEGQPFFFSPESHTHVSRPWYESAGVTAFVLDGESTETVDLPDFAATDNQTRRVVRGELSADGTVVASSEETLIGVAAAAMRERLQSMTPDERKGAVQDRLQRHMPGLVLTSLEIENLDDPDEDLVLESEWRVEGYATAAGKRLILNPHLFERVATSDWAPESRTVDIDLGAKRDTHETVMLKLPDGTKDVTAPDSVRQPGPPVGLYQSEYGRRGQMLVAKRAMRLDMVKLAAGYYPGLRTWFSGIAAADEQPVVIELE